MVNPVRLEQPEGILFLQPLFIGNYHDDEGRPLGENKTSEACKMGVPMELTRCPYAGSRRHHPKPMNRSALKQVLKHWPEVTAALSFLRKVYVSGRPAGDVTLLEFWKIAKASALVPCYLAYRGQGRLGDGEIPAFVAALHKTALGLFDTAQHMVFKGIATGEYKKDERADAEAMAEFADQQEVLIGSKEVCAGPPHLIKEAMLAITEGSESESGLSRLIPELQPFLRYVTQEQVIHILNFLFPLLSYSIVADVSRVVSAESKRQGASTAITKLLQDLSEVEARHPEVVRSFVRMGKSICGTYLISLNELISNLDGQTGIAPVVRQAGQPGGEERSRLGEAIHSFIDREGSEKASAVNKYLLKVLTDALANYLVMERKRLKAYTLMQTEVNAALLRQAVPRPLDGADVTRCFGKTLRDALSEFFGIEIHNTATASRLSRDSIEIVC